MSPAFWLGFTIVVVILLILFIIKYGVQPGIWVSTTLSGPQLRNLFKKHYCKQCQTRLIKESEDIYKGKGWSETPEPIYGEKYERIYSFKCPSCNRVYSLDDV